MSIRVVALLLLCTTGVSHATDKFTFGRFGETVVYRPAVVRHVALFFSDERGWSAADATLSQALADTGVLVAGIDLHRYAIQLSKPRDKCSYLAGEFEDFSHEFQKRFSPARYHMPVLIGTGEGASLVYAVAAQGSSGTFIGTLTLGFQPHWKPPLKLCQSYELRYTAGKNGLVVLAPSPRLSTPWVAVHAAEDKRWSVGELQKFVAAVGTAKAVVLSGGVAAVQTSAQWRKDVVANVNRLAEPDREERVDADELRDLPLEEVRVNDAETSRMALFLTGDGGWAEIDKGVSGELARRGIDVVALSSLQYFWQPRSPDGTAKDVARILRHYLVAWHKTQVLVVGYSFGADVAPFVVNRLPDDIRSKIASVSLLGLSETADFEVHVTTWLGVDHHGVSTKPEVRRLKVPTLCIYGDGEQDSACPQLAGTNVRVVKVGDGHHFGNRYDELAKSIVSMSTTERSGK